MKKAKSAFYESPEVELMGVNAEQVICGSMDGNINDMTWGDDDSNNWE